MARSFDGTNDRVVFGTSAAQFVNTFTATAWVKFPSNFTAERQILAKMDGSYLGKMYLRCDDTRQNAISCYLSRTPTYNDAVAQRSISAADALTAGVWNFVCATCDTTNSPKLYVSVAGTAAAEVSYSVQQAGSGAYTGSDTAALMVATRTPLDTYWVGEIAETALWNRVLSADEIRALSLGFAPGFFPRGQLFYAPLIGRYSPEANIPPGGDTWGTVTEATAADHPGVIYPSRGPVVLRTPLAIPAGDPFIVRQSTVRGGDILRGVAAILSATLNQVSETDLAQPLAVNPQRRLVGPASETDLAQALAVNPQRRLVGQASETDSAQAFTAAKVQALGQSQETDLAQALTVNPQRRLVAHAVETDLAQALTAAKTQPLGQSQETDLAQPLTLTKSRTLGQAAETDLAQAVASQKLAALSQATETDAAQALTSLKTAIIGQVEEIDLAQPITRQGGITVGLTPAVETDLAQALTVNPIRRLVGQASETDSAQAFASVKALPVGQASETDSAQPITARKFRIVNLASETDLAQSLAVQKLRGVAIAVETDLAQALTSSKVAALGQAQETDLAQLITYAVFLVGYIRIVNLSGTLPTGRAITGRLPEAASVTGQLAQVSDVTGVL